MATFKDTKGREWELCVSTTTVKRIRKRFNINILGIVEEDAAVWRMLSDPIEFVDVLWFLIAEQAKAVDVDDEEFGGAMYGDVILDARNEFLEALADFFQDLKRREAIRKIIQIAKATEERMMQAGMEEIAKIDPDGLAKELMNSALTSAASSGSTPDR